MNTEEEMSINKYYLLILLVISIIISFFLKNSIYNAFLSTVIFFMYPFLAGFSIVYFINKFYKSNLEYIFVFCISWAIGSLILYILAILLSIMHFDMFILILISLPALILSFQKIDKKIIVNKRKLYIYLIIIFLAIILIILFRSFSNYPYSLAWDQTIYGSEANKIINGNEFHIFTNQFSETMHILKYRPAIFDIILGLSCFISSVNPLMSSWAFPFILTILFGIFMFKLSKKITLNNYISLLIVFLSMSIFEHTNMNGLRGISTASIILLFMPAILLFALTYAKENKTIWLIYIWSIILILIQLYEGIILFLFSLFSIIFIKYKNKKIIKLFSFIALVISLLILFGISMQKLNFIYNVNLFNFLSLNWGWDFKAILLDRWYSWNILILSIIGSGLIIFKKEEYESNILATLFLYTFIIYSLNISAIFRVATFIHVLIPIFAIYPIMKFTRSKIIKIIFILLILLLSTSPLMGFSNYYHGKIGSSEFSSFSKAELDSAIDLNKEISTSSLIIGEPEQTTFIAGYIGAESLGGRSPRENDKVCINSFLNSNTSCKAKLCDNYSNIYIISSYRSESWKQINGTDNIYFPKNNTNGKTLQLNFTKIYNGGDGIEVYRINCSSNLVSPTNNSSTIATNQ